MVVVVSSTPLLTAEERTRRDLLYAVLEEAGTKITCFEAAAGATCIAIRNEQLWREDYATFSDFLADRCGSKTTAYRWMTVAATAAAFPDEDWLASKPTIAAELYKLRESPALQEIVLRNARDARFEEVKKFVAEVRADPIRKQLVTSDPEFGRNLEHLAAEAQVAMRSRVDQQTATSRPVVPPRRTLRSVEKIRTARRILADAFLLGSQEVTSAQQRATALSELDQVAIEVDDLRRLYGSAGSAKQDSPS
jgi:hypothetical protein